MKTNTNCFISKIRDNNQRANTIIAVNIPVSEEAVNMYYG